MTVSTLNPVFVPLRGIKKHNCPNCGRRSWVPFGHYETREVLEGFGFCDHAVSCGFQRHPNRETVLEWNRKNSDGTVRGGPIGRRVHPSPQPAIPDPVFVPDAVLDGFQRHVWDSYFVQYLSCCLPYPHTPKQMDSVVRDYRLGGVRLDSGDAMAGSVVFPFIDAAGRVRSMQAVKYDPQTNKRQAFDWAHKMELRRPRPARWALDFETYQTAGGKVIPCLFGAHLIGETTQTVVICEAPKTAIYMALRMPIDGVTYAATASLGNLTVDRLRDCAGKSVVLCPDLSPDGQAFQRWSARAEQLRRELGIVVNVDETLERIATPEQRSSGWDYADFLFDFNWMDHAKTGE